MSDSHFELLLHAARSQPVPQRLLFVFANATLPADATAAQRSSFDAGEGGELDPVMSVDKDPHALTTFAALAAESMQMGQGWHVVFVAGLSGRGTIAPTEAQTEHALSQMVESVRRGDFGRYLAYDSRGEPISIS
ncbi:MAG TPA: ribonucleotide reductase subunit alpha [Casimicrobiaceae bacterium]|nr:ribonucleotide reductase subunit alpha [Casimicrobiaceae bacterium]